VGTPTQLKVTREENISSVLFTQSQCEKILRIAGRDADA